MEVIMCCPLDLFEVFGSLAINLNFFNCFEIFSPLYMFVEEACVVVSSF